MDFYGTCVLTLKLLGQPNIRQTTHGDVTRHGMYHSAGVRVDRSVKPNRVWVADTGNNRYLGFASLGTCSDEPARQCTNDTDCTGGDTCVVDPTKDADIIIGQPDDASAECNGDNNLGLFLPPTASTLCLMRTPVYTNVAEQWRYQNLDVDADGNLYLVDVYNDRVLKYNDPLSSGTADGQGDAVADFVWGQPEFGSNGINRGRGPGSPDARSLYVSYYQPAARGVSVDPDGNVWVADGGNGRVLRFPPGSPSADLVLGRGNGGFTVSGGGSWGADCWTEAPLDRMCTPLLARINPETGELYVIDENNVPDWFGVRILVFSPPFASGQSADRVIRAQLEGFLEPWNIEYFFTASTLEFNSFREGEYADGVIWVNEHAAQGQRTTLLDDAGEIVALIGARHPLEQGGDSAYWHEGCGDIYEGFRLWWPAGSMGFDDDDNIYLADEFFYRVARYGLPYTLVPNGDETCLPDPNGGFLGPNPYSRSKFRETVGMVADGGQIIVRDWRRTRVWSDYMSKPMGAEADFLIPLGGTTHHAVDDQGRLWTADEHGRLMVFQLPITEEDQQPVGFDVQLHWRDSGEVVYLEAFGFAFDDVSRTLWVGDRHRILRVSNYNDLGGQLEVDMVLGQRDRDTVMCNHDQEEGWIAPGPPTADSLCRVLDMRFDQLGNLYVVENNYECHGNNRVTVFMAEDLQQATAMIPNIPASKVFVRRSLTEEVSCDAYPPNEPRYPVSVAFDSHNHMVIGNDGYYVDESVRAWRQLWYYEDPLKKNSQGEFIQGQLPDAYINLPMGAAGELWFDEQDRLVVLDYTWARVWVIDLEERDHTGRLIWLRDLPD